MIRRALSGLGAGLALALLVATPALAATPAPTAATPPATPAQTQSTTGTVQSYAADKPLQFGTVVQLVDDKKTSKVIPATFDKASQMYGIVVDPRTLSVTVSGSGLANETYAAANGTYPTLVSTQNGVIRTGDYVTISAVDGVVMLAQPEQKIVFGRAAANFDGKSNVISTLSIKDKAGKELSKAALGSIPVVIDIRRNPDEKSTKANVPKVLQRLGEAVAEKPIGPLRIYLSIGIAGISTIAAIAIMYSGVRSSLIAIGRNPLSKKSIFRALAEIVLTALIVLIVGLFAVYLLLKL